MRRKCSGSRARVRADPSRRRPLLVCAAHCGSVGRHRAILRVTAQLPLRYNGKRVGDLSYPSNAHYDEQDPDAAHEGSSLSIFWKIDKSFIFKGYFNSIIYYKYI